MYNLRRSFSESQVAAEKKKQVELLREVEAMVDGKGAKMEAESYQGKKLICRFKPVQVKQV